MIDPNLPLELDDGTPVELDPKFASNERNIYVRVPKDPERLGRKKFSCAALFYYRRKDGIFGGGNAKRYYVLQNVVDAPHVPEDWS